MTEKEFMLLDELYFVIGYQELEASVEMPTAEIRETLMSLWDKGWLRCYHGVDYELDHSSIDLENLFDKYHYLASKEGLMVHNRR